MTHLRVVASNPGLVERKPTAPDPAEIALAVAAATSAAIALERLMTPAAEELHKLTAAINRLQELGATRELIALTPLVAAVAEMLRSFK